MCIRDRPAGERVPVPADRVPCLVVVVVALVVVLRVGRVGAARHLGHPGHRPGGQHHRAGAGLQLGHHLLDRDQAAPGREHGLLLHAGDAPHLHVAGPIGALRVHDRHVRVERGHGHQLLPGERAGDRLDGGGVRGQVGAPVAAQHRERQAGRAGHVPVGHAGVAVLLQFQRHRPGVLHGIAEPVQRADPGVATPGEDQLACAAGADHLVVDDVRGHPHQGEVPPALADDLLPSRHRNQVREALQRHHITVVDQVRDGVGQRDDLSHRALRSYSERMFL